MIFTIPQLKKTAEASGGSTPSTSYLTRLPQTLNETSLLVWNMTFTTAELALAGQLDSLFCSDLINSSRLVIKTKPDIMAVIRSGIYICYLATCAI